MNNRTAVSGLVIHNFFLNIFAGQTVAHTVGVGYKMVFFGCIDPKCNSKESKSNFKFYVNMR